ncbi:MAG: hypothetical protein IJZ47_10510 [Oscillospiraceae bacterium]|nr:hypothetical protein [Oscillospiraceae bacterium]
MVEVSENYRALALANGRHVYCRITVDGEEFLDDRLLEFTFDDVTHPDWFTVGTACANRFHFRVNYTGELDVGAEVRPYVSFDGEEWCGLGIFYISRRYVRGSSISVTAYDRMYSLDTAYTYSGVLPTTTDALLERICTENGITAAEYGIAHGVSYIPENCTVRDMIGFIAGINRACAKIDRNGALVFRKGDLRNNNEHISHLNCMDIQRNLTRSVVTCLKAQTDGELLTAGEGAEISTLETYNPLMTQDRLEQLYSLFKPFSFYGADVEMQGLPYLESGEGILLLDGQMTYPIVISEIELRYDGGLYATLYSRNKTMVEAAPYQDDLEQALAALRNLSGATAFSSENEALVDIGEDEPVKLVQFTIQGYKGGFAQLDVNMSLGQYTCNYVLFRIYVNGELRRELKHVPHYIAGTLEHLYHLERDLPDGQCTITVTAQTGAGIAKIQPKAMMAGLVVHGAGQS